MKCKAWLVDMSDLNNIKIDLITDDEKEYSREDMSPSIDGSIGKYLFPKEDIWGADDTSFKKELLYFMLEEIQSNIEKILIESV